MSDFKNPFLNSGPSLANNDSFTILSFLIVSISTFSFTEVILFIYYFLVTFSKALIQCPFCAKTFIKILFPELKTLPKKCAVCVIKTL